MFVHLLLGRHEHLKRHDLQIALLEPLDDLPGQTFSEHRRLHHHERLLLFRMRHCIVLKNYKVRLDFLLDSE